jgi:hypothetical protein
MTLDLTKYDQEPQADGTIVLRPKAVDWSEWVPKDGDKYWYLTSTGSLGLAIWSEHDMDSVRLWQGNVYPTEAMALAALPDIRRCMQIIRACRLVEPDYVPDWTDDSQKHYSYESGGILNVSSCVYNKVSPAYVSTEKKARKVIELLERVKP